MTCPICKHGKMDKGFTTLVFEAGNSTIIVKKVPADVCDNCHESFIPEEISRKVLKTVDNEVKKGVELEVLHYAA
ncbi:MAG: type II toxin-antitoxin system MqsA family antitoxin [Planctomycetes bacterium]|nr:type II toxin-antitoxin system MqsA family antitoxin [Planctomycetota bacterium]